MISERTKAALAAKKVQGAKLGNPRNIESASALGRATQMATADQFFAALVPVVDAVRNAGASTLEAISCALNDKGVRTVRGARWHVSTVANFLARVQKLGEARKNGVTIFT